MRVLFLGDVVGEVACRHLTKTLSTYKREQGVDVTIANGENSANGNGITQASARSLFSAGIDVITTGNHAFQRREHLSVFENPCVLRPLNFGAEAIGSGYTIYDLGSARICVINLQGRLFLEPNDNPFVWMDQLLRTIDTPNIFVDFHAEATSEKRAMGYYLQGRVTAVLGTHTHVQTADACILGGHTGYITDVGMTGVIDSILGLEPKPILDRFVHHTPTRAGEAGGLCSMGCALVDFDKKTGKCLAISAKNVG